MALYRVPGMSYLRHIRRERDQLWEKGLTLHEPFSMQYHEDQNQIINTNHIIRINLIE